MIRRPPRSTLSSSSAASDVYKRQLQQQLQQPFHSGVAPFPPVRRHTSATCPPPFGGVFSKYRPPCFPFPDFPPYPVETPHIHGTPSTEGTFTRYLFPCMRQWWGHRFCNFCGSETPGSRPAPSNRHRKAPDSRQRAGQGAPNESQNRPRRRQGDAKSAKWRPRQTPTGSDAPFG